MPDWAIGSLILCVEDDENHVTYGCVGLSDTEWESIPASGYLLHKVVAAGSAYLNGPQSCRQAARFEFERVCQQWQVISDDRFRRGIMGKKRAANAKEKIDASHQNWLTKALELERRGMDQRYVAARIAKDYSINAAGVKARRIRDVLREKGFYHRK